MSHSEERDAGLGNPPKPRPRRLTLRRYVNARNGGHGFGHALTCAGGLVGPALIAGLGFVLARRERVAQVGRPWPPLGSPLGQFDRFELPGFAEVSAQRTWAMLDLQ